MPASVWFIIVGLVFSLVVLVGSSVKHLPLSTALIYLAVGIVLGPGVTSLLTVHLPRDAWWIEHLTEIAIAISLFATGLNLRAPWNDARWRCVARLGFGATGLTVLLTTAAAVWLFGLSWGAALLLAAVLAPTDPVLARDVQLEHPFDPSPLRFGLTGEAGVNDGTAFPFVLLGLGLLGLPAGATGLRWLTVDVAWAIASGLAIGYALGAVQVRLVLRLRQRYKQAVGLDHFLALGLIALSYGAATAMHGYGFLAVFAAGLALRRVELDQVGEDPPEHLTQLAVAPSQREAVATDRKQAPVYLAQVALRFTELLEQVGEAFVVTLVGAMLTPAILSWRVAGFLALLFVVIRPAAVAGALAGAGLPRIDRGLLAWFGIRGLASIYYTAYAVTHGLSGEVAQAVTSIALAAVAVSVVAHGVSVTPLMRAYAHQAEG